MYYWYEMVILQSQQITYKDNLIFKSNIFEERSTFIRMRSQEESSNYQKIKGITFSRQKLRVVSMTWNLFGSLPPTNSVVQLFQTQLFDPLADVIYIGTQECQVSLCWATLCESKEQWQLLLREVLERKDYYLAASSILVGLHSVIFLKKQLKPYFQMERTNTLKAGYCCNLFGNKGALTIEATILGQQFQFINCHLAPHQNSNQERNSTIQRIMRELVTKDLRTEVIFLGDFNYRIDMDHEEYEKSIENKLNTDAVMGYSKMLDRDQLRKQESLYQYFLVEFEEGNIAFPPTYKIGIHSDQYHRERIPGWTDRIFHRKSNKMQRLKYLCEYGIRGCDHRPVLALYEKRIEEGTEIIQDEFVGVKGSKSCSLI